MKHGRFAGDFAFCEPISFLGFSGNVGSVVVTGMLWSAVVEIQKTIMWIASAI